MTFSEILRELLQERNTNAKQVSVYLGIEDSTTYKYFGTTLPRIEKAVLLANYFDCSLNYLMGIDDNPKSVKFKQTYDKSLFFKRYDGLLKQNNLTHYELCNKTGIAKSSLYAWKKGTVPYLDVLEKIARYFSCSIDYLVGRTDK